MKGFLKKIIPSGKTIGVALSGGEDSVCLLDYLVSKKGLFNIEVVAVNVEHGIRGEESLLDTAFCKELGCIEILFLLDFLTLHFSAQVNITYCLHR